MRIGAISIIVQSRCPSKSHGARLPPEFDQDRICVGMGMGKRFEPIALGALELPNRIVRAATDASMADAKGRPLPSLSRLYRPLARAGTGLIMNCNYVRASRQSSFFRTQRAFERRGIPRTLQISSARLIQTSISPGERLPHMK